MTPVNIVATASAMGIDIVAIADHNSIKNVESAMEVGEVLGVTVVPAFELQPMKIFIFFAYSPTLKG
jgi:predicted metal-dependent phosphoesterase TrpH